MQADLDPSPRARTSELGARLRAAAAGHDQRRIDPGRRGLLAMLAVAVLVALVAGGWVLSSRPRQLPTGGPSVTSEPALADSAAADPTVSGSTAASSSPAGLVVDVAGKVRRPGVYRLPTGARVQDAVAAAGGMLPGVNPVAVNLARRLADGEQVVIGLPSPAGAAAPPAPDGSTPVGSGGTPVDLNTATVAQLDALPGVGPVLAQRIVDWRSQHGRFDSVDQLSGVSGIGDAKLADLKPLVTVS